MANDAALIQRFVESFTRLDDSTYSHDEPPPPEFSAGTDPDDWIVIRWQPAAISTTPDALSLIRRVGVLPRLYEQLVLSYRWPEVDLSVCRLLPSLPANDLFPLSNSMFADSVVNNALVPNGFARFALAPNGSYDPICFDLNRLANGDCPVVRIDHECVLMRDTIGDATTVFGSFRELVNAVIEISP